MNNENTTTDEGREYTEPAAPVNAPAPTLHDSLRSLRMRHQQAHGFQPATEEEAAEDVLDLETYEAQSFLPASEEESAEDILDLGTYEAQSFPQNSGGESADASGSWLDDSLRSLRLRRYEAQSFWSPLQAEPAESESEETPLNLEAQEGEADEPAAQTVAETVEGRQESEEESDKLSVAFDEMSQEVRRLGREMFRATRVSERNQEIFDEAITEIRHLSSTVALIPAQHNETINAAKFEAKAELCRELLRMSDTLQASLFAAGELIDQLQTTVNSPAGTEGAEGARGVKRGLAFRFSTTRQLSDSLAKSVAAMKQWRDGQQLLFERLQSILRTAGVREIETAGRAFDPAMHRAVSAVESNELAAGTIAGEELKGYTLDGRILRYAEVIVAK